VHHLGGTRSSLKSDHLLQTPDTFVRTPLPGSQAIEFIVHASPRLGARFTWMTAEFAQGGELGPTEAERFLYMLEGTVVLSTAGRTHSLGPASFAYMPGEMPHTISAAQPARAVLIEKPYQRQPGASRPEMIVSEEAAIGTVPLMGDEGLQVRSLMPDNSSYDFAVNTMSYAPGASLAQVEIHVMEHGLLMLEGGGIYRLGDSWYQVAAGDFIWMAPYCPQWFGALGKKPAKYLIYKDWRRHPQQDRRP
jgi:(S)-ureidoglycine aminohydrolase